MTNNILETMIKHWIKKIKEAGFEDPTKEVIKYKHGDKNIVIQLHTEEQWEKKNSKTQAQRVLKNIRLDKTPDYTVCVDGVIYLVEMLKK